jgi:hypothetical protein
MLSLSVIAPAALADSAASEWSSILNAIAPLLWPLLVAAVIVIFRKPLGAAVGRVTEVDVGTTKVVLQNAADNAANTAKKVHTDTMPATGQQIAGASAGTKDEISAAKASGTSDPAGSVLKAWLAVENATREPGAQLAPGVAVSPSVPAVVNELTKSKGLDSSLVPVAETLQSMRQMAARSPKTITPATAMSFVSAAGDLADLIVHAGST